MPPPSPEAPCTRAAARWSSAPEPAPIRNPENPSPSASRPVRTPMRAGRSPATSSRVSTATVRVRIGPEAATHSSRPRDSRQSWSRLAQYGGPSQVRVRSVGSRSTAAARPAAAPPPAATWRVALPAGPLATATRPAPRRTPPPATALRNLRRSGRPAPTDDDLQARTGRLGRVVLDAHQPLAHGQCGRLQLGVDAQLDQHVLHVGADGVERQVAGLGDAAVGVAAGQQGEHLALARGQAAQQQLGVVVALGRLGAVDSVLPGGVDSVRPGGVDSGARPFRLSATLPFGGPMITGRG